MQLCQQLQIFRNETRFENQILRRVSGHRQLGREHEFRARRGEPLIRAGDQFAVSPQISDGRVNLSETNLHAALSAGYAQPSMRQARSGHLRYRHSGSRRSVVRRRTHLTSNPPADRLTYSLPLLFGLSANPSMPLASLRLIRRGEHRRLCGLEFLLHHFGYVSAIFPAAHRKKLA